MLFYLFLYDLVYFNGGILILILITETTSEANSGVR